MLYRSAVFWPQASSWKPRQEPRGKAGSCTQAKQKGRHQARYGKCKSGGIWNSRQVPAPVGMVLFPRLLTCSDNCTVYCGSWTCALRSSCFGFLLALPPVGCSFWSLLLGLASWPGPVLPGPVYLMHVLQYFARFFSLWASWATRCVIFKSLDTVGYLGSGSCLVVHPGHCLYSTTWSYPGHSLLRCYCVIAPVQPLHSGLLQDADTQKTHRP